MNKKKSILEFLQNKKLDLIQQVPGFVDARFEDVDDEPKLLIFVDTPLDGEVRLSHNGDILPVEVRVSDGEEIQESQKTVVISLDNSTTGNPSPQVISSKAKDDVIGVVALPTEEAIGPHMDSKVAKNKASYEAWIARHPHVKVK